MENRKWSGTRYDEACERCGHEGEVENATGLCRRCFNAKYPAKIDTTCEAPYQRGIGQGFGTTEDGQE
mgnify:FL=1